MVMNKTLRFSFFAAVLIMVAVAIFAFSFRTHAAGSSTVTPSKVVTINASIIKKIHVGYTFRRSTITMSFHNMFTFTNLTNATQSVTLNGKTVVTLAGHAKAPYVFPATGTYTFGLVSNTAAKLTVTVQ